MIISKVTILLAYPLYFLFKDVFGLSVVSSTNIFYMLLCAGIATEYVRYYSVNPVDVNEYLINLIVAAYYCNAAVYFIDLIFGNIIHTTFPIFTIIGGTTLSILWLFLRHLRALVRLKY